MSNKTPNDLPAKTVSALRRFGLGLIFVLLVVAGLYGFANRSHNTICDINPKLTTKQVSGDGHVLTAEVADDNDSRVRGLSGRNCLDEDRAMLFEYDLSGDYCFWMKNMKFPIDMIWLDDEKKIVTIKTNVSPDTYPQSFCPDRPAQYILEVGANEAARLNWRIGTQLSF